jgi:hypothetical protein
MKSPSLRWLFGAPAAGLVMWFVGCLNPRPEDFPSRRDTTPTLDTPDMSNSSGDEGAGVGSVDVQGTGGSAAGVPATPQPPSSLTPGADADAGADVPTEDAGADAQ